jgi:hypothetical protein
MKYRLKALGWHFCASIGLLLLMVGTLYLGWYRWPGWYLAGMLTVLPITVGVDAALGPLLTFIIASPSKPLGELARDISFIALMQLTALLYGGITLWHGRPLYYAYSGNELSVVQGTDLDTAEIALGRKKNPELAPYWYSVPRWIYAPSLAAHTVEGADATSKPRYFQPWANGLPDLRSKLKPVDEWRYFSMTQRNVLKKRLAEQGFGADYAATMPMTGRDVPLLAVFDSKTLEIKALLRAKP